ncbi:MAG: DcrB-related protein [Enterobacter hormaechei]
MIAFPEGYQDRTVNVFAPPAADAPAFNISRDALNPGEALAAYIDRQLALMAKHLKGWKQGERSAARGDGLSRGGSAAREQTHLAAAAVLTSTAIKFWSSRGLHHAPSDADRRCLAIFSGLSLHH